MLIDDLDHVIDVRGDARLSEVEAYCDSKGYTLDLRSVPDISIAAWTAEGFPGTRSPLLDPADHVIAGLHGILKNGQAIEIAKCPRRAAGPDWTALFCGQWGRFGTVTRLWIRIFPKGVVRPAMETTIESNPPLTPMEEVMLVILERELS
jgi:alkyldihydroxyacetonephosphate synthase